MTSSRIERGLASPLAPFPRGLPDYFAMVVTAFHGAGKPAWSRLGIGGGSAVGGVLVFVGGAGWG